jgi:hypothetical protein
MRKLKKPAFFLILAFLLLACFIQLRHYDLLIAYRGFTPVAWTYKFVNPALFQNNFVSGIEQYDKSIFLRVYPILFQAFQILPEALYPLVVCLEIFLVAFAGIAIIRTLFPQASTSVYLLMVVWLVGSFARDMSLSRFAHPFFVGQFYNIADVLRIFAILLAFKNRFVLAGLLLAASLAVHPIYGVTGIFFVLASMLPRGKQYPIRSWLCVTLLPVLLAAPWFLTAYQSHTTAQVTQSIPEHWWYCLTRLNSSHWYPFSSGLFTLNASRCLFSYCAMLLMLTYYWLKKKPWQDLDSRLLAGLAGALTLTLAGLVFSFAPPSPIFIKLALHRADDLLILFGLAFLSYGFISEIEESSTPFWRKALIIVLMVVPMFLDPGFPVVWAILLVVSSCLKELKVGLRDKRLFILLGASVGIVLLGLLYLLVGWTRWFGPTYLGDFPFLYVALGIIAATGLLHLLEKKWKYALLKPVLAIFILCCGLLGAQAVNHKMLRPKYYPEARSYKEAQLWARSKTPETALFMVDPTIYYGWRDFSLRNSFGNVREWLYSGWLYDSNPVVFEKGMQRFAEFNLPLQPYLNTFPSGKGFAKLTRDVRQVYYQWRDEQRLAIAKKYGIDFMVLKRSEMTQPSALPVVYQNEHFLVLQTQIP